MLKIKSRSWSDGSDAVGKAWQSFKEQWLNWVLLYLAINCITVFCSVIPYAGNLISTFVGVILNGIVIGIIHRQISKKEMFSMDKLGDIFNEVIDKFLVFAAICAGIWFVFGIVGIVSI